MHGHQSYIPSNLVCSAGGRRGKSSRLSQHPQDEALQTTSGVFLCGLEVNERASCAVTLLSRCSWGPGYECVCVCVCVRVWGGGVYYQDEDTGQPLSTLRLGRGGLSIQDQPQTEPIQEGRP